MKDDLEERIIRNISTIVPPEHVLQLNEDLLWGNVSPFKRDLGDKVIFIKDMAHFYTRNGLGATKLISDTPGKYAYQEDGEPYTQSRDSFYFTCLLDPKAEELIDHMKANMPLSAEKDHFNILQTHLVAESIHLKRFSQQEIFGIKQDHTMLATREQVEAHHERLFTKAILDFNMTEESLKASKGNRADIEIDIKYFALFERNKLNNILAEKPLTKAQQLSNDIESEDFTYRPATTKTARTKL